MPLRHKESEKETEAMVKTASASATRTPTVRYTELSPSRFKTFRRV